MTVSAFVFSGAMEAFIFVPLMPLILEAVRDADSQIPSKKLSSSFGNLSSIHGSDGIDLHVNDKASSVF
jgi:hypothetical protein